MYELSMAYTRGVFTLQHIYTGLRLENVLFQRNRHLPLHAYSYIKTRLKGELLPQGLTTAARCQ